MIVNNKWFPYSTNARSLRWERGGMKLPLLDAVTMLALLGGIPAFLLISAKAGIHPAFNVFQAAVSVMAYLTYEQLNPLQKYTGVPLDGVMLDMLQGFLDTPLTELAKDRRAHGIIDRYVQSEWVRDNAATQVFHNEGSQSDALAYLRAHSALHHEARHTALQVKDATMEVAA